MAYIPDSNSLVVTSQGQARTNHAQEITRTRASVAMAMLRGSGGIPGLLAALTNEEFQEFIHDLLPALKHEVEVRGFSSLY